MKIYVAAPWTCKEDAKRYAEALEAAGHTITKKWWEHREVPGYLLASLTVSNRIELETQAQEDVKGVLDAEAFVLLNLEKSEGKAFESGVAVLVGCLRAQGHYSAGPLQFILVGGKSNLFHYLGLWEEADNPADVIALLQ